VIPLFLAEAKRTLRAPIWWPGLGLLGGYALINGRDYWPSVPLDVDFLYQGIAVLAGFALLLGGWVGLRDRRHGTQALLSSTPSEARGLSVVARLAALGVAGMASFALIYVVAAGTSWSFGGRGVSDPRVLVDGGLVIALGAIIGFGIGSLTGSRIAVLLGPPLLSAIDLYLGGHYSQSFGAHTLEWILPAPVPPYRYGPLGYLPDIWTPHIAYLAGLPPLRSSGCAPTAPRLWRARG
jgi:hypothetical protein